MFIIGMMGSIYPSTEIPPTQGTGVNLPMVGCRWPGDGQSPIRYGPNKCVGVPCDSSCVRVQQDSSISLGPPYLQFDDTGVAYPENACITYSKVGPYKRRSNGVYVSTQPGKRVCVMSNGNLSVSDVALRRVLHSQNKTVMPGVSCSCCMVNSYPNAPMYSDLGYRGMMCNSYSTMFGYPQVMGLNTCRVPTTYCGTTSDSRFPNGCVPQDSNVLVYLNSDQDIVDIYGWRYVDTLGEGSYGKVYFVRNEFTSEESAFKRMLLHKSGAMPPAILREIHSLRSCNHENVIKLNKVYVGDCRVYLSFPRIVGGNLRQLLEKHYPTGVPLDNVRSIAKQLISGIAHIHSRRIIHRDIKPENILVETEFQDDLQVPRVASDDESSCSDAPGSLCGDIGIGQFIEPTVRPRIKRVVISDFGLSRVHKSVDHPLFENDESKLMNSPMSPEVVTLCYRPPELLLGDFHYSFSVDIWSLGCVLFELITGKPIFEERTEFALLIAMFRRFGTPKEEDWPDLTSLPFMNPSLPNIRTSSCLVECLNKVDRDCMDLLERMLALNPQKRISAREAIVHPWIVKA
uniref:Cyclin-dependent kinase 2 homolog n=1 Tax=Babesia bovis TaxID=5865 RepID=A7AMC3_BABBO|eukprot:XP_001611275.1 protein kinase domain containing protein [Babesia bovis T2Bo]